MAEIEKAHRTALSVWNELVRRGGLQPEGRAAELTDKVRGALDCEADSLEEALRGTAGAAFVGTLFRCLVTRFTSTTTRGLPEQADGKEIARENPGVNLRKLQEGIRMQENLRKAGVRVPGHRLCPPHDRKRMRLDRSSSALRIPNS